MTRTEIETLARFAACLLSEEGETPRNALDSFSDPDEIVAIAKRAWVEIEDNGGFREERDTIEVSREDLALARSIIRDLCHDWPAHELADDPER
ncbi:MAG: hypothetical protein ACYDDA_13695, partial [Acidiferrobacteraceae bacterium]